MFDSVKYWESVANVIEESFKHGALKQWDESTISIFLIHLENTVRAKLSEDPEMAERCGVPYIKGRYAIEQWRTIDSSTFRRIFIYRKSSGSKQTRQQFAIYLGYTSFEEFCIKNSIVSKKDKEKVELPKKDYTAVLKRIALPKVFNWMLLWLLTSLLLHNILGIFKGNLSYPIWIKIFWIPPLAVIATMFFFKWFAGIVKKQLLFYSILWWTGIVVSIILNQYIPGWIHFVLISSVMIIGIIGQIGLSTNLAIVSNKKVADFNNKNRLIRLDRFSVNTAIQSYIISLCFGLLLIALMWLVQDETISDYRSKSQTLAQFRVYVSIEMIVSFALLTVGFKKLILNPLVYFNGE